MGMLDFKDPVVWGSLVSVLVAVVIFVYLAFKVKALINKDAASHEK